MIGTGLLIWIGLIALLAGAGLYSIRRWFDSEHEKDKERRKWREQGPP